MLKAPAIHPPTNGLQAPGGLNWWGFLWASVVFIIYGSIFPFDFVSEAKPISEFYGEWHMFRNIPDASDNFLLFIPLGIGLDACFLRRGRLFGASLVAWLVLGVGVQLVQLYLPTRTAALSDALWNAVGLVFGVLAFKRARLTIDHIQRASAGPHDGYAMLLVALWFCYESFPFVPTLDIGELRDHIKTVVVAPPFELMRLLQHGLAAVLAGMAMLRANWLQPRWLNVVIPGSLAVFLEVFVAYGSLRRETLMGMVGGLLLGYALAAYKPQKAPVLAITVALGALLITVLTPYRGQALGAGFTFTPFADVFWKGVTVDVSPSAFEALAVGVLLWPGSFLRGSAHNARTLWVCAVVVLLILLEVVRMYVVGYRGDTTPLTMALILASFQMGFSKSMPVVSMRPALSTPEDAKKAMTKQTATVSIRAHLVVISVLALVLAALSHFPGLPYNVRALFGPGIGGSLSALAVALTVYGMANGVFLLLASKWRKWFMLFPLILAVHGMLTWWILRYSVPSKSLLDIVGTPSLGWPGELELIGRYVALHLAIMLQLIGGALCVRLIFRPSTLGDVVYWAIISLTLSWPLYLVVVQWAVTDNLTELMANDASYWACSAWASALLLTCFAASAVSSALSAQRQTKTLVLSAFAAAVGAITLFWLGAESTIVKYGSVFSAFQFLLSTDRAHYAHGVDLMLRFGVAFLGICCGLAALQWAFWRRLCTDARPKQKQRGP